jgi:hypothetical protein
MFKGIKAHGNEILSARERLNAASEAAGVKLGGRSAAPPPRACLRIRQEIADAPKIKHAESRLPRTTPQRAAHSKLPDSFAKGSAVLFCVSRQKPARDRRIRETDWRGSRNVPAALAPSWQNPWTAFPTRSLDHPQGLFLCFKQGELLR